MSKDASKRTGRTSKPQTRARKDLMLHHANYGVVVPSSSLLMRSSRSLVDATLEQGDIVFKRSSRLAPNVPVVVEVVQCTYSHIVYDKWAADGYHETEYCLDIYPFLLPPDGALHWEMKFEPEKDCFDLTPNVTMLAIDVLGEKAALTESNLHERFPDVFPRFWYSGSSPLIIIEGDATPTWTPYTYIEVPTNEYIDGVDGTDEEKSDILEPSSKRIKIASSSSLRSRKTIRVGMPTLYYTVTGLADLLPRLEDSTHRPIAIIGFIISVLGGTLHLTYPPTLTDAQLYCEVIALSEQLSYKLAGLEATFSSTMHSFLRPQPVAIDPPNDILTQLAASTWVSCNQNETCLSLIASCLSSESDQIRLLKRIGHLVTLNPRLFIQMVRSSPHDQGRDYKPPSSTLDRRENRVTLRHDRTPRLGPVIPNMTRVQSNSEHCLQQCYALGTWKLGNEKIVWQTSFDPQEPIPLDFISIVPTGDAKVPNQTKTRFLAHTSLLVEHWPYFARLMNSGLSEAQTRVVRLPLSTGLVKALLYCLYTVDDPLRYLKKLEAAELIERGSEFGFGKSGTKHQVHTRPFVERVWLRAKAVEGEGEF